MSTDLLAREQCERHDELKAIRDAQFRATWQLLSQYNLPQQSNINTQKLPGNITSWTQEIYETTAIQSAQVLAAGQRNWLTPSSEPWGAFEPPEYLTVEGKEQDKDEAAQWLANATDIAMRELARSNFYAMVNIDYTTISVFATGMLFVEEGRKTALNFRQFKPWDITIEEDCEGIVDTVRREFPLTTRQAVQQFGIDKVGKKIAEAYGSGKDMAKKWRFLHACFPRDDSQRLPDRKDGPNKPIASVYIAMDECICIEVSGYDENPYLCSRFQSWGADTPWGYGPAYLTLPDARQLNYVSQYRDALAELKAYPRLLYPDNLEGDVDLRAGGVTVFDASVNNGAPREWMPVGDDKAAEENMVRHADAIKNAFYVPMFQLLANLADKKMTAYEISQRLAEKLELFTPVFDRRVTEFLNPLLKRVFGILYRMGKFGQAPQGLMISTDGGKTQHLAMPEIAITSRISLALKALKNQGIESTLQTIMPLAQMRPDVLDNLELDTMVRDLARNNGVPPDVLTKLKKMAAFRQQQAQHQAQQQAAMMAQQLAGTAKDLGKAPPQLQQAIGQQMSGAAA